MAKAAEIQGRKISQALGNFRQSQVAASLRSSLSAPVFRAPLKPSSQSELALHVLCGRGMRFVFGFV